MKRFYPWLLATCLLVLFAAPAQAAAAVDEDGTVWRHNTGIAHLQGQGLDGDGVTVALIDSGVADVPALQGVVIKQVNFSAASPDGDQFGHGTFVAGLIHEAAPNAKIISLKLSGADGSVDVSQVLAAMQWVVAHKQQYGIDAVNLSFGNNSIQSYRTSLLNYAVERAWDAGIVVSASTGNDPTRVTKPADDPLIISVGSVDDQKTVSSHDDIVSDFSGRGPTQDGLAKPDMVAPGRSMISLRAPGSTIDEAYPHARVGEAYFRGSGTSFSTAITTGAVAQLLEDDPGATPDQIKDVLMRSATLIAGDQASQGAGALNVKRAQQLQKTMASQDHKPRGSGSGSLEQDRGDVHVLITPWGLESTADFLLGTTVPQLLQGDLTAAGRVFDHLEYTTGEWDASRWGSSQWVASRWGAVQWEASRWGSGEWDASRWGASRWGSSTWWASRWG